MDKMKKFDKKFVTEFIEYLAGGEEPLAVVLTEYENDPYFVMEDYGDGWCKLIDTAGYFNGYYWRMLQGCTKIVFVFENLPYVIKMNVYGELIIGKELRSGEDRIDLYSIDFIEGENAIDYDKRAMVCEPYSTNYIYEECELYDRASDTVKNFLLKDHFIVRVNAIEIYQQLKISSTYEDYECSPDYEEFANEYESIVAERPDVIDFCACCNNSFSEVFLAQMYLQDDEIKYCVDELDELDDIQAGNYGYVVEDGKPRCVIFDYGGFWD